MTKITLELDIKNNNFVIEEAEKQKLAFIVSKVYEEYLEDLQDKKLSEQINNSEELGEIIDKIEV